MEPGSSSTGSRAHARLIARSGTSALLSVLAETRPSLTNKASPASAEHPAIRSEESPSVTAAQPHSHVRLSHVLSHGHARCIVVHVCVLVMHIGTVSCVRVFSNR